MSIAPSLFRACLAKPVSHLQYLLFLPTRLSLPPPLPIQPRIACLELWFPLLSHLVHFLSPHVPSRGSPIPFEMKLLCRCRSLARNISRNGPPKERSSVVYNCSPGATSPPHPPPSVRLMFSLINPPTFHVCMYLVCPSTHAGARRRNVGRRSREHIIHHHHYHQTLRLAPLCRRLLSLPSSVSSGCVGMSPSAVLLLAFDSLPSLGKKRGHENLFTKSLNASPWFWYPLHGVRRTRQKPRNGFLRAGPAVKIRKSHSLEITR